MLIQWIIIIICIILLFILLLKLIKRVIITIFLFFFIVLLALAGLSYAVYLDISDTINQMPTTSFLVLISDQDNFITGANYIPNTEQPEMLNSENITYFNEQYQKGNYNSFLLQPNSKWITIKIEALKPYFSDQIEIGNTLITKEEYLKYLSSLTPFDDIITSLSNKSNIKIPLNYSSSNMTDSSSIKLMILMMALKDEQLMNLSEPQQVIPFFLSEYQKENIKIYPKTITLRLLDLVPSSLVESILSATTK